MSLIIPILGYLWFLQNFLSQVGVYPLGVWVSAQSSPLQCDNSHPRREWLCATQIATHSYTHENAYMTVAGSFTQITWLFCNSLQENYTGKWEKMLRATRTSGVKLLRDGTQNTRFYRAPIWTIINWGTWFKWFLFK
jgi:hypothetical protein